MKSRWFDLKETAIKMRLKGNSVRNIENLLGIPRSTLSGWLKNIEIGKKHKIALQKKWEESLVGARKSAAIWHNKQKEIRIKIAEQGAFDILEKIDCEDENILNLALAMLYLGEGFKKTSDTGIGNSDPLILKFFVSILQRNFNIKLEKITCYLHLRVDQDKNDMKKYWSKELHIPLENFKSVSIDSRTKNSLTHVDYKGVCVVRCGNIAIQRKLVYLSRKFCDKIISNWAVSSFS